MYCFMDMALLRLTQMLRSFDRFYGNPHPNEHDGVCCLQLFCPFFFLCITPNIPIVAVQNHSLCITLIIISYSQTSRFKLDNCVSHQHCTEHGMVTCDGATARRSNYNCRKMLKKSKKLATMSPKKLRATYAEEKWQITNLSFTNRLKSVCNIVAILQMLEISLQLILWLLVL